MATTGDVLTVAVYHQMGHQSHNLLYESGLEGYKGIILSPVNYNEQDMLPLIRKFRAERQGEIVFDPQLYYPRTELVKIRKWSYFPNDFETGDSASEPWWESRLHDLITTVATLNPDSVCSPAFVPNTFANEYFDLMVRVGNHLVAALDGSHIGVWQTVLVNPRDLTKPDRVYEIASVITRTRADRIYLVFVSEMEPRREIGDTEILKGAMRLIRLLEGSGLSVLVGFSSSDVILWKAAGATACATGKFWNLRRFTPSRWDPDDAGGGQLAYWFEESLLAALRESDVIRVERNDLLSSHSQANPFCRSILDRIHCNGAQAWVALGWRQFMYWFASIESRIQNRAVDPMQLVRTAEKNWEKLEDLDLFMEEKRNDGRWLRHWLRALVEFSQT